jgi:transposase InsO family protein
MTAGRDRIASGTAFRTACATTLIQLVLDQAALSRREVAVRFRHRKLFCLRGFGLPPAEGARPDRQSGLHRHRGGRCVQGQHHRPQPALATGFTYLKVIGSGWFYLSTVLDDFSRYIVAWKLCTSMRAEDVTATLDLALRASGLDHAKPADRPRLLSDNGSSYIAGDLAKWLDDRNIKHLRGAPYHPMTQGKIERWHQTLKNRVLLENYFLPGDLEVQLPPPSTTTTTTDTTKESTISPPPTSVAGAARLSWPNDKGSNDRPLPTVACSTARGRPNSITSMRQSLP